MNKPVFKMDLMNPGDWVDRDIIQRDGRNATMILIVSLGNIVPRIKGMEATGATIRAVSCGSYYIIKNS